MKILLEEVFKTSGIPIHTFVKPQEYTKLIVSLRTKGRGLIIEGPSGIGKTTSINRAIQEIDLHASVLSLSAGVGRTRQKRTSQNSSCPRHRLAASPPEADRRCSSRPAARLRP